MRPIPACFVTGALAVALLLAPPANAQTSSPGLPTVTKRVDEPSLPRVIPLAIRNIEGQGTGLGCVLETGGSREVLLRARCNESVEVGELVTGLSASLITPADMAYAYDGFYVCGVVSSAVADRDGNIRLDVYFHELLVANDGSRLMQRRDTGLDNARRGLTYLIPASQFRGLETDASTEGQRPCVTLPFAAGQQSGNQPRLPGDIWVPQTEFDMFMRLPAMLSVISPGQFGDAFTVSQIGLTVAGRRPVQP